MLHLIRRTVAIHVLRPGQRARVFGHVPIARIVRHRRLEPRDLGVVDPRPDEAENGISRAWPSALINVGLPASSRCAVRLQSPRR
jgi:hypothetical protein